jgi:hypothetical protein
MGVVKVQASFNKLNSGQTSIILLRSNQRSNGIANGVNACCHLEEFTSFSASNIRRNIKLLVQLL